MCVCVRTVQLCHTKGPPRLLSFPLKWPKQKGHDKFEIITFLEASFSSQQLGDFLYPQPNTSARLLMLTASRTAFKFISPFGSNNILPTLPDFMYALSRRQRKQNDGLEHFFYVSIRCNFSLWWRSLPCSLFKFLFWFHGFYTTSKILWQDTFWDECSRRKKNDISHLFETLVIILSLAKQNTHQPSFSVMFCLLQAQPQKCWFVQYADKGWKNIYAKITSVIKNESVSLSHSKVFYTFHSKGWGQAGVLTPCDSGVKDPKRREQSKKKAS